MLIYVASRIILDGFDSPPPLASPFTDYVKITSSDPGKRPKPSPQDVNKFKLFVWQAKRLNEDKVQ